MKWILLIFVLMSMNCGQHFFVDPKLMEEHRQFERDREEARHAKMANRHAEEARLRASIKRTEEEAARRVAEYEELRRKSIPRIGTKCSFKYDATVSESLAIYQRARQLSIAKDYDGQRELVTIGVAFEVQKGTKCLVIQNIEIGIWTYTEVRILDGKHSRLSAWSQPFWLEWQK